MSANLSNKNIMAQSPVHNGTISTGEKQTSNSRKCMHATPLISQHVYIVDETGKKLEVIINSIGEWLLSRKEYFDIFARNDTRLESWFKAEILVLFSRLMKEGVVDAFEREPSLHDETGKRLQIDFSVTIQGAKHYFELKALCISQSKGTPRNLSFYFRDNNVGIIKDFKKLDRIRTKNKWVVAFVYPKPSEENWSKITNRLSRWKCLTDLKDYPNHIFIALFQS